MFGFFKRKQALTSPGDRSRAEQVNALELAEAVLTKHGHKVCSDGTCLLHEETGFAIYPQVHEVVPLDRGGVRTVSTIGVKHPKVVPAGVFEYQHSTGDNLAESVSQGFDQWAQTDFVALQEALREKPECCTTMEMGFPATAERPARMRRAVLGPVSHLVMEPPANPGDEEHPFCPCCLLTNTFLAFKELIEGDGFYGLRFFATRDAQGVAQADCRVNGEEWLPGAEALKEYTKSWPPRGLEWRKQYVILQTIDKTSRPDPSPCEA